MIIIQTNKIKAIKPTPMLYHYELVSWNDKNHRYHDILKLQVGGESNNYYIRDVRLECLNPNVQYEYPDYIRHLKSQNEKGEKT